MGLGILGGGVATARWLSGEGAELTVTDLKDKEYLKPSLEKLKNLDIKFVLGRHDEKDFLETDILVINPDVSAANPFIEIARKAGKTVENELTLFFKYAKYKSIVGITGTRGKTTTTNWIGAILKNAGKEVVILGNDPDRPFLSEIDNCAENTIAVVEMPSYQLEILNSSGFAPHVAVITNLYQDHLVRHQTMQNYALVKSNIFKNQKEDDFLILNKNNEWTKFFLNKKPKSKVIFSSDISLPNFDAEKFSLEFGEHNLANFLAAASACVYLGVSVEDVLKSIEYLPQIKFREELVYDKNELQIYNDTTATSPEATIAALQRFCKNNIKVILITGGTDRELDFGDWGQQVKKCLNQENIVLLSGSATEKMKAALGLMSEEYDNLESCLWSAVKKTEKSGNKSIILFSPSSKSFEKFKNEFDRGEQFNAIIHGLLE